MVEQNSDAAFQKQGYGHYFYFYSTKGKSMIWKCKLRPETLCVFANICTDSILTERQPRIHSDDKAMNADASPATRSRSLTSSKLMNSLRFSCSCFYSRINQAIALNSLWAIMFFFCFFLFLYFFWGGGVAFCSHVNFKEGLYACLH